MESRICKRMGKKRRDFFSRKEDSTRTIQKGAEAISAIERDREKKARRGSFPAPYRLLGKTAFGRTLDGYSNPENP